MKKIAIFALCFVLGLGILTACGNRNSADETSQPSTGASTNATTTPTTSATKPTTAPTTPSTSNGMEDGKIDGNGDAASKSGRVNKMP